MTKRKILVSVIFALIFYSAVKKISITFFSNLLEIDASGYWIIVYFLSAAFLGFILKYQTNRQDIENRIIEYFKILNYIKVNIVILTFIVFWFLTPLIAKNEIGATFEKSEYQTRYYVNLFPQKDSIENYRVLADISAHYNEYHIKKAYFNNDEYITFNNENEYNSYTLKTNKKVPLKDDNKKEWYVELTNKKFNENKYSKSSSESNEIPKIPAVNKMIGS